MLPLVKQVLMQELSWVSFGYKQHGTWLNSYTYLFVISCFKILDTVVCKLISTVYTQV